MVTARMPRRLRTSPSSWHARSLGRAGFALAGLVLACRSAPQTEDRASAQAQASLDEKRSAPVELSAPASGGGDAPRVVVAVIIDQLGSDTLLRHLDLLDAGGAIRRAVDAGVYLERSAYSYANTLTAPGHASVFTGAAPERSGIEGNSMWDPARLRSVPVTEDPRFPTFGREAAGVGGSPARLRAPTVAQSLRAATGGAAKVISLSIKERSAILSVGSAADLVLWYDPELGAFTSSSVWGPALPGWLSSYQREHPIRALVKPWDAERPELYRARLGPDDAPGEGLIPGFGTTFPHRVDGMDDPLRFLPNTPMLSEYLVSLTEFAAAQVGVGKDAVPDLIALSISGTDASGHVFGPGSWEYVDHLIRADRALGAWLDRLAHSTSMSVVITSDHGVAPLPEAHGSGAVRIAPSRLEQRLEAALTAQFGAGDWVAGLVSPFVYLSAAARQRPDRERLVEVARGALLEEPVVQAAWTLAAVRAFGDADPIESALRRSVGPENDADLMFLQKPFCPYDPGVPADRGTNHGSPYDYDRQVPVLAWGAQVPHHRSSEPTDQMRVAATIAHLLGVPAPDLASPGSLF